MNTSPPDLLIDVRSEDEFLGNYGHIPSAKWIPMLELENRLDEITKFKEKEIVTM